jgi:hypothetical protein
MGSIPVGGATYKARKVQILAAFSFAMSLKLFDTKRFKYRIYWI